MSDDAVSMICGTVIFLAMGGFILAACVCWLGPELRRECAARPALPPREEVDLFNWTYKTTTTTTGPVVEGQKPVEETVKRSPAPWRNKRTPETLLVERLFNEQGFVVDAYLFNDASVRLRCIDKHFEGMSQQERDAIFVAISDELPESIRRKLVTAPLLYTPLEQSHLVEAISRNRQFEEVL